MHGIERQRESQWPHLWSVVLAVTTFPLIWVGGLVTSTKSGMAVPDWPTTYGYNMFLYPWTTWLFGPWDIFIEHGHRLLASLVGIIAIALVCTAHRRHSPIELKFAAWGALVLVIIQGVLGGMRVRLDQQLLAMVHGCVGPLFFLYCCVLVELTSPRWSDVFDSQLQAASAASYGVISPSQGAVRHGDSPGSFEPSNRYSGGTESSVSALRSSKLFYQSLFSVGLVYLQIVLGAQIRHAPVTMNPRLFQLVVVFHVVVAAAVVAQVAYWIFLISQTSGGLSTIVGGRFRRLAQWLVVLIAIQVLLGGWAWVVRRGWPSWFVDWELASGYLVEAKSLTYWLVPTAHTAIGALILGLSGLLCTRSARESITTPTPHRDSLLGGSEMGHNRTFRTAMEGCG